MVTSDSGRSLERSLRDARLDDPIERDRALAATEAALFGRPAAPLRFGRYLLLDRIGAGGQGVVHAAYDPELDRRVAIKLLGTRGSSARHADLLREAQAAAKLAHPNVLAIHDVGVFEQRPFGAADTPDHGVYVVSELVDGETFDVWRARGAPSTDAIIEVMCAVGRGLAAAHACGLVHADVKPTNVLIDREAVLACSTSGSRAPSVPRGRGPTSPGPSRARRRTWLPSSSAAARTSTHAPTCSRRASCSTRRCSDGDRSTAQTELRCCPRSCAVRSTSRARLVCRAGPSAYCSAGSPAIARTGTRRCSRSSKRWSAGMHARCGWRSASQ